MCSYINPMIGCGLLVSMEPVTFGVGYVDFTILFVEVTVRRGNRVETEKQIASTFPYVSRPTHGKSCIICPQEIN